MKFVYYIFAISFCLIVFSENLVAESMNEDQKKIIKLLKQKENFLFLPTPLHKLEKISEMYKGYEIYIKRDDMTGLAFGGNKSRKLEYIIYEARKKGAQVLITYGSPQSNHARQTAAACRMLKVECYLFLTHHKDNKTAKLEGNLLLDYLLDAKIVISNSKEESNEKINQLKEKLKAENKKYYYIPLGGSNPTGCLGYANAFREILNQEKFLNIKFDYIIHASASLATQAGLILGRKVFNTNHKIIGISIVKHPLDVKYNKMQQKMNILMDKFNKAFNTNIELEDGDFNIDERFRKNYEVMGENEIKAIDMFAKHESIILDPVYTGRAAGGMLYMLEHNEFPQNSKILFLHTGGTPLVFTKIFKINKFKKK